MNSTKTNKNCISWWLPKLWDANIPTPATVLVAAPDGWHNILGVFDDPERHEKEFSEGMKLLDELARRLADAVELTSLGVGTNPGGIELGSNASSTITYPLFLRSGLTSNKHNWKRSCFVQSRDDLRDHAQQIICFSDMVGLTWETWAVRELLPTTPVTTLPGYGDFPLTREVRCFVGRGEVLCWHIYWPETAICEGLQPSATEMRASGQKPRRPEELQEIARELWHRANPAGEISQWGPIATKVAKTFERHGEEFSVDLLQTDRGWIVTDMAEGILSWHDANCTRTKAKSKP